MASLRPCSVLPQQPTLRKWQHQRNLKAMLMRCALLHTKGRDSKFCVCVCVVLHLLRSDHKIRNRVLMNKKPSRFPCLRKRTSCLDSGRPLRRLIIHASAVSLSKFRILPRWYRVGSSSCGLNNRQLCSQIASAFAAASCCGFSGVHLRLGPNFPRFRTCGHLLACTHGSLRLFSIFMHNLRTCSFVPFGSDALRVDKCWLTGLRESSCITS